MADTVLDMVAAALARDEILDFVVKTRGATWLDRARVVARSLAKKKGSVTADDVRHVLDMASLAPPPHVNAWGNVFKHSDFVPTGEHKRSEMPGRRGGKQRVWCLA